MARTKQSAKHTTGGAAAKVSLGDILQRVQQGRVAQQPSGSVIGKLPGGPPAPSDADDEVDMFLMTRFYTF